MAALGSKAHERRLLRRQQKVIDNNSPRRKLARQVQDLPPELYNQIFDYVFTSDYEIRRPDEWPEVIDQPKYLRVNRTSRELYARSYFGNTTFTARYESNNWLKWLRCLPRSHLSMIRSLQIEVLTRILDEDQLRAATVRRFCEIFAELVRGRIARTLKTSTGLVIDESVVRVEIHADCFESTSPIVD